MIAKKPEQKVSAIIATVASLLVIGSALWAMMGQKEPEKTETPKAETVVVTQKPAINKITSPVITSPIKAEKQKQIASIMAGYASTEETATSEEKSVETTLPDTAPTKKTASVKNNASKQYYVQVGAFKNQKLANALLKKMRSHYQHAEIMIKDDLYLVWVGPVTSNSDASALQKEIYNKDKIKGFTKIKK